MKDGKRSSTKIHQQSQVGALDGAGEKLPQVLRLLRLSEEIELFHTPDKHAYATVALNGHNENFELRSTDFSTYLAHRYYLETKGAPTRQALQEATRVLESKALFAGPEKPVFTRISEYEGKIYVDLANNIRQVVEVDAAGWRVLAEAPVKFRRTHGMRLLPNPVNGGTIDELRPFVNVASDQDWILLIACILMMFRPRGPYPILVLHGEQGSAKSTVAKLVRLLVDPNAADLRPQPRNDTDLMIAAHNGWVLSLDNMSYIPSWLSDSLCRVATGGGFGARQLYTNTGETLFDVQRPIVVNGIEELATRGDLLDRCLVFHLPAIPEIRRRSEDQFWAEFKLVMARIFGTLLNGVCAGLKGLTDVKLSAMPRMADFTRWGTALEPFLGLATGSFSRVYASKREATNSLALEASSIAQAVICIAHRGFEGTCTDLLKVLPQDADQSMRRQPDWPNSVKSLANALRRLVPNLRAVGVEVSFVRDNNRERTRRVTIRRLPSASSGSSEDLQGAAVGRTHADAGQAQSTPEIPGANELKGLGLGRTPDAMDGPDVSPPLSNSHEAARYVDDIL